MDYSVLLEIEHLQSGKQKESRATKMKCRNEFSSHNRYEVYHIGVVDFLVTYTTRKKIETAIKTRCGSRNLTQAVSCIPPDPYQKRIMMFLRR